MVDQVGAEGLIQEFQACAVDELQGHDCQADESQTDGNIQQFRPAAAFRAQKQHKDGSKDKDCI